MPSLRFGPRPSLALFFLAFGASYLLFCLYQYSSVPGLVRYDESKAQVQEVSLQTRRQEQGALIAREARETEYNVGAQESVQLQNSEELFCHLLEGKRISSFPVKEVWDTESGAACCAECQNFQNSEDPLKSCNGWSYCSQQEPCKGDYRKCELFHAHWPQVMNYQFSETHGVWTSGYLQNRGLEQPPAHQGGDRQYHTIVTTQGKASHWQIQIAFYWFKKRKAECEADPPCDMGGFTRILHSGKPDDLMETIPTFLAEPLPATHNANKDGYVVLNRPNSILQWLQQATIPEKYVLMAEPDHLLLKPLPNMMVGENPVAYGFLYMNAQETDIARIVRKFIGDVSDAELEKVAPIGNSPSMMTLADLNKVVPMWVDMSDKIYNDQEANKKWGWILEMYAFSIAYYKVGTWPIHTRREFMAQPPFPPWICHEGEFCPYHILHYTYRVTDAPEGMEGDPETSSWMFNKRDYSTTAPPKNGLPLPPANVTNSLIRNIIEMMNEATNNIEGWDEREARASL
ncbi:hypothetical protein BSKO_05327 [Bryopsis sp. KO-2023]|nr:hypothetical protein BSKO_05327 [Bryopsis sp. KO-2023]